MAISYQSQKFQDAYKEAEERISQGAITSKEDMDKFIASKEIKGEDYWKAFDKFEEAVQKGDTDARPMGGGEGALLRTAGRFAGEVAGGVQAAADLVTGGYASEAVDTVTSMLPDTVQEYASEIFDPYHGEGMLGVGEDVVGTLGSYIAGGGLLLKGAAQGAKMAKGLKATSNVSKPGAKSLISQQFKNLNKEARKKAVTSARRKQKLGTAAKEGTAFAGAATLIDRPEDGVVNALVDAFPESTEFLERLYVNPDDSEAEAKLKTFIANLGITVPFSVFTLASAFKKPIAEGASVGFKKTKDAVTSLPYLNKLPAIAANFDSRLGTDDTMLSLLVKASKGTEAGVIRAEGLAADLSKVARNEYGSTIPANVIDNMDKALKGNTTALTSLKPETKKIILEMRDNIDNLSKEARGLGIKGKLGSKIDKGLGTYITRSYNFFDDADFKKNTLKNFQKFIKDGTDEQGVFSNALNDIQKMTGQSSQEALTTLRKVLRAENDETMAQSLENITRFGKFTTVKSGKERSEFLTESDNIRMLLGEVSDPFKNYVKTAGNLARITTEQKFLSGVAKHLKGKFNNEAVESLSDLSQIGTQRLSKIFGGSAGDVTNPLENVYASPIYKEAIEKGLDVIQSDSLLGKAFAKSKGISQAAKTAYNPSTHGRNVMGNAILMTANGMIPFFGKGGMQSLSSTWSMLRGKSSKELGEKLAEYTELGIIGSGVQQNVIKNNLKKYAQDPDGALLDSITKSSGSTLGGLKPLNKKVLQTYQAEDDIFKIAHYEKTLNALRKSPKYKDATEQEIKDAAAQRTRDLMPNYNLVPRAFKNLRAMPVGDFMSFPAEMTRVTKNLVKYTLQDIKSGDPVLAREGYKRLAGLTAMGAAPAYFSEKSRIANGITEDQVEALENIGKEWEYNQDKIYLSPLEVDKNDHVGVKYFNLGPIDPFSYLKTGAQTAHALIMNGVMDDEAIAYETDKLALSTLDQVFGPFLAPSMVTDALVTAIAPGQYGDSLVEGAMKGNLEERLAPLVKTFTPGFLDFIMRRREFEQSRAKQEGIGREALKKFGTTYKEYEVDMPALLGLKRDYLDISNSVSFNVAPIIGDVRGATSKLNKALRTNPNLNDPNEITQMYTDSQKKKYESMQRLRGLLIDYETLFGTEDFGQAFYDGLTTGRRAPKPEAFLETINEASNNVFNPDAVPFGDFLDVTRPAIDFDMLENTRRQLIGVPLIPEPQPEEEDELQ